MNSKKEGEYYSQMVRKYREEYGGKNLHDILNRVMGNPLGFAAFPRKN